MTWKLKGRAQVISQASMLSDNLYLRGQGNFSLVWQLINYNHLTWPNTPRSPLWTGTQICLFHRFLLLTITLNMTKQFAMWYFAGIHSFIIFCLINIFFSLSRPTSYCRSSLTSITSLAYPNIFLPLRCMPFFSPPKARIPIKLAVCWGLRLDPYWQLSIYESIHYTLIPKFSSTHIKKVSYPPFIVKPN